MPQLRIGLAQVNAVVGDLTGNADLVATGVAQAAERGCHLVAFPEMVLTGYPPEDLVLRGSFVQASIDALHALAARLEVEGHGDVAVVVGYCGRSEKPMPALGRPAGEPQNSAAVLHGGRVVATYAKHHLPNYGVFDEFRYFVRGDRFPVVRLHGVDIGLVICEDLWQEGGPIAVAREVGVGLVVCINGSPYERGKDDVRGALAQRKAVEAGAALAYVNLIGGQDELVFDGDSLVVDAAGAIVARAQLWEEALLVCDLDLPAAGDVTDGPVDARDGTTLAVETFVLSQAALPPWTAEPPEVAVPLSDEAEIWGALVTATRDYVHKSGYTRSVVIALSGGIDSAVTATIAADALGPDNVHVVGLPSPWSSDHSVDDAADLAQRQGLHWSVVPIAAAMAAWEPLALTGLAAENLQARIRGVTVMALANQHQRLVLTAGNKTELATGYSTLYGADTTGAFAPLKDVPKTLVWRLARWRNTLGEVIPPHSISKPPSAELSPGQLDSDSLPPYDILDAVLEDYVERDLGRAELIAAGHDEAVVDRVIRLVDTAEYKRRQYPPGPKISPRAFGRDRRLPITSRWRELPVTVPTAT